MSYQISWEPTQSGATYSAYMCRFITIRLEWKCFVGSNAQAYYAKACIGRHCTHHNDTLHFIVTLCVVMPSVVTPSVVAP